MGWSTDFTQIQNSKYKGSVEVDKAEKYTLGFIPSLENIKVRLDGTTDLVENFSVYCRELD